MRRSLYVKDDDYRLSFLYGNFTTLDPLHRARPRAGRHRAALAAVRVDPRHRPRRPGGDAAQPPGATSLRWLARPARRRDRGPRPDRGLPGRERRRRPRRHAGRDPRRVSRASPRSACVPLGVSRFSHEESHARPHARRGGGGRRPGRGVAGDGSLAALGRRLVFAADEYYLLAGRAFPAARLLRGLPAARERNRDGGRAFAAAFGGDDRPASPEPAVSSASSTAPPLSATGRRARRRPATIGEWVPVPSPPR